MALLFCFLLSVFCHQFDGLIPVFFFLACFIAIVQTSVPGVYTGSISFHDNPKRQKLGDILCIPD